MKPAHTGRYTVDAANQDRSNAHRTISPTLFAHRQRPDHSMRPFVVLLAAVTVASCRDPRAEANIAQAMIQMGTEISGIQQDYAILQSQVDSLRNVVARQDSLIAKLSTALGNIPISPR